MSLRKKRTSTECGFEKESKRKRIGINVYIPINKLNISDDSLASSSSASSSCSASSSSCKKEEKIYTQEEVSYLLTKQELTFRSLLEEKLREQFNIFNQLYIDNIFKEYKQTEVPYIN
jgi:hypothetical protein